MAPPLAPSLLPQKEGFWGEATSTLDWCEQNYEVTYYIAEFWNSMSNAAFIVPPLLVAWQLRKQVETLYLMSLVFLSFAGLGSFAFHATLKFYPQLWDELSMVWVGLYQAYLIINAMHPVKSNVLPVSLISYGLITTTLYLVNRTPILFQVAYALIHLTCLYLGYQMKDRFKSIKRSLFYWSFWSSVVAFTLWNIDNQFCPQLEALRSTMTPCLTPFTQLHGYWHCLAGYSAFSVFLCTIHARLEALKHNYRLTSHPMAGLTLVKVHSSSPLHCNQVDQSAPVSELFTSLSGGVASRFQHLIKTYSSRKSE